MSKMNVVFTKMTVEDPAAVALAKASGQTVTAIVSAVNQQRYRQAYNKLRQAEIKALRALVKANPELLKG